MMKKIIFTLFVALLLLSPASAETVSSADVGIYATTQIGQPIPIELIMPEEVESINIEWQNLQTVLKVSSTSDDKNIFNCILGTDLQNAKAGLHKIKLSWTENGFLTTEEYTIDLTTKSYPTEKLTVAPEMTDLSDEVKARVKKESILTREALHTNTPGAAPKLPLVRPVPGIYTSPYGKSRIFNGQFRGRHSGIDFRAAIGTPIKSVADGVVVLTGNFWFSGNFVMIDHGAGLISFYCHMSKIDVEKKQEVKAGETVGKTGQTGRVTGPHLHFGIAWNGEYFDADPLFENKAEKITLQ